MKKSVFILFLSLTILIAGFWKFKNYKKNAIFTIAIMQGASHESLNAANKSFQEEMIKLIGKDKITFLNYNAEGSTIQAYSIAQQTNANTHIDLFYTISCATSQALHSIEKKRPVVFIGVENPHELGFLHKNTNMCGITDAVPVEAVSSLIEKTVPYAKRIGLFYQNESSRKKIAEEIKTTLSKQNYDVLEFTPLNDLEILPQLQSMPLNVDAIISFADSMVAANIATMVTFALTHKKPFLVCMKNSAHFGALASRGTDYEENGRQAARMAYDILINNKNPYEIPLESGGYKDIYLNQDTMTKIGINIKNKDEFILI